MTVSNAPNCFATDTVTVFVSGECPEIYVPTGFSPNGDNNNDLFYVLGREVKEFHFTVYNRWGQIVFETNDQTAAWDGTQNGKPVQSGVYAYKLTYKLPTDKEGVILHGNITVLK